MDTASRKLYAVSRYNKIQGIVWYNLIPQTINEWMNAYKREGDLLHSCAIFWAEINAIE